MTAKTRKFCIERWKISTRSIGADYFVAVRAGDTARLLDRIETLLPYLLGDRPNH